MSKPDDRPRLGDLLDVHAVGLLGISGQEFRRRWYAQVYRGVDHPAVVALDRLMRTGQWVPPSVGSPTG